ncbi:MAG TPA: squalene/phytoene synthase family protein [Jatrophihabitans sp.]|jgi:squalene synthase HpnC
MTTAAEELQRVAARSAEQIGAENFPVALRLLPKAPRDALTRVYAYARFVDDIGDEASGDRLAMLDLIDADVRALWSGRATLPPVLALAPHTEVLPQQALLNLVEANRIDQRTTRYETFDDLIGYCTLSAAPVGRVVLSIARVNDPEAIRRSDEVCNALQVLEHCQDIAEDARAGRVYLPARELRAAGIPDADVETLLTAPAASAVLRQVVATQVDRAGRLLGEGRPLVSSLGGWARLAVAGYVAGGLATIQAIRGARYDTLSRPVTPSKGRTVAHALPLYLGR